MRLFTGSFMLLVLFMFSYVSRGQSVESLRNEREALLMEISNTTQLLKKKKASRQDNLNQLQLMEREIRARENLLENYREEISQLDGQIEINQMLINDLESDIERLKKEYSRLIQDSYRRKGELNELMFLFGAEHFREAYLRYRLFKEYSRFRQKQGEVLVESQNKVRGLVSQIRLQKEEKQAILDRIENELGQLQSGKTLKQSVITKLQGEEQWLQRTLKEKEATALKLEQKILDIIAAEKNVTEDVVGSSDFNAQMGQLIWPVQQGVVINPFGKHEHPVLKRVIINNNGIDIQASTRVDVFAVHGGTVSTVVGIPGLNKAVIVRHGKFLTVYANLVAVSVSKGEVVNAGQILGQLARSDGDIQSVLHFEIWEENRKLDPEQWLRR